MRSEAIKKQLYLDYTLTTAGIILLGCTHETYELATAPSAVRKYAHRCIAEAKQKRQTSLHFELQQVDKIIVVHDSSGRGVALGLLGQPQLAGFGQSSLIYVNPNWRRKKLSLFLEVIMTWRAYELGYRGMTTAVYSSNRVGQARIDYLNKYRPLFTFYGREFDAPPEERCN